MRVGVVLLNWNTSELTIACIESVMEGHVLPWRIVVIDNGSSDGSADHIRERFTQLQVIGNEENIGFAAGTNMGIRNLLDEGADAVWILNNDTLVDKGCLGALADRLAAHDELPVVTGKILFEQPANHIWYAGGSLNEKTFTVTHHGYGEKDCGQYNVEKLVTFVSGCNMLIHRQAFESVGLLDERFFAYYEDVEWCCRAKAHGLTMVYVPTAVITHKVSASVKKNTLKANRGEISPFAHYMEARNRLYTLRLHSQSRRQWVSAMAIYAMHNAFLLTGLLARGRRDKLKQRARGIRDGLTQNLRPGQTGLNRKNL